MKVEAPKQLDIIRVGEDDGGVEAGIDASSLPFILEMVSKNLYSNPIGSIIRELTSNCLDSHIEAGIDEPVVISKDYDSDEGWSIQFKDIGIGMDGKTLVNVYMKWFTSTKRDTNELIGGFGIGSKTPLAYTDLFYITSVKDGKKYECILHKGETLPKLESLYGEEEVFEPIGEDEARTYPTERILIDEFNSHFLKFKYPLGEETEERNGTVVKIIMEKADVAKFENELKFQLSYFDSVYFNSWNISNDYDIYEGKHFKFRSDILKSVPSWEEVPIHICIGNVRYPIDFSKVQLGAKYKKCPIAVKFAIGELPVTPSREQIRYTDEVVTLMKQRITQAVDEVIDMFNRQNPEVDTLEIWDKVKDEKAKYVFNKAKQHYLYAWANSDIASSHKFKPVMDIGAIKTPRNIFFMYNHIGVIESDGRRKDSKYGRSIDNSDVIKNKVILINNQDRPNQYTHAYIAEKFGRSVVLVKRNKVNYDYIAKELGLKDSKKLGKAMIIVKYFKVVEKELLKYGGRYSDYRPSQEWINDYKKRQKESSPAYLRKLGQKIIIRDASHDFKTREINMNELDGRTGILVYGFKDDREQLRYIYDIVTDNKQSIANLKSKHGSSSKKLQQAFMVIQIARANEEFIKGPKKTIYWKDFMNTLFFRQILVAHSTYNELSRNTIREHALRVELVKGYAIEYAKIFLTISPHFNIGTRLYAKTDENIRQLEEYLPTDCNPLVLKKSREIKEVYNRFKEKYHFKIPLINALKPNVMDNLDTRESFIDYLKSIHIRLENKWYLIPPIEIKN